MKKALVITFTTIWVILFVAILLFGLGMNGKMGNQIIIIGTHDFEPLFKPYQIIKEVELKPEERAELKEGDVIVYNNYFGNEERKLYAIVQEKREGYVGVRTIKTNDDSHFIQTTVIDGKLVATMTWLSPMVWLLYSQYGKITLGIFAVITAFSMFFIIKAMRKEGNI